MDGDMAVGPMITQFYYPLLQGAQGDEKMAAFPKDTFIQVTSVDDNSIYIQIGPNGYTIDKGELALAMSGTNDDWETIKSNIVLTLVLDGVNVQDDVALKRSIERKPFKAFR